MWVDTSVEFKTYDFEEFYKIAKRTNGLAVYHGTGHSIFAVTPPQMTEYFPPVKNLTTKECLVAGALGIFRTKQVIDNFLKWWVACALSSSCIFSETKKGCDFQMSDSDKWTKYGHCSRFDQSAMSILIENMYSDEEAPPHMQYSTIDIKRAKGEIAHPQICDDTNI